MIRTILVIAGFLLITPNAISQTDGTTIDQSGINYVGRRAEHRQKAMACMFGGRSGQFPVNDFDRRSKSDTLSSLRGGFHVGVEAAWFTHRNLGLGVRAVRSQRSGPRHIQYTEFGTGTVHAIDGTERVTIDLIAPTLYMRLYSGSELLIIMFDLSVGHIGYRNNLTLPAPMRHSGNTMGYLFGLRMDHMINDHFSLGIGFSQLSGKLREIAVKDGNNEYILALTEDKSELLVRLDISIGLRWYW